MCVCEFFIGVKSTQKKKKKKAQSTCVSLNEFLQTEHTQNADQETKH